MPSGAPDFPAKISFALYYAITDAEGDRELDVSYGRFKAWF